MGVRFGDVTASSKCSLPGCQSPSAECPYGRRIGCDCFIATEPPGNPTEMPSLHYANVQWALNSKVGAGNCACSAAATVAQPLEDAYVYSRSVCLVQG